MAQTRILYLIQLPPPVHGVSVINELIYGNDSIHGDIERFMLQLRFSTHITEIRKFSFHKLHIFFQLYKKLRTTLEDINPDYVYFSLMPIGKGLWRDLFYVRLIKKKNKSLIYHLHNRGISENAKGILKCAIYKYIFNNSLVIHLSEKLIEEEIKPLGLSGIVTRVVPNGIPRIPLGKKTSNGDKLRLLFLSNLFPAKGLLALIHIAKNLKSRSLKFELRVVGEFMNERYRNKISSLIKSHNLEGYLVLSGPKYGVAKWNEYQNSDIFLFPSFFREECFPLVLLEALQAGLPIVASGIGAIPEIVDATTGFLHDPWDYNAFSKSILMLNNNRNMLSQMSKAAMLRYERNFTENHLINRIRRIYVEELIQKG